MRLFDMHCDTLYECYFGKQQLFQNQLHLDLKRGLQYDDWAQAFAVWMPDTLRGDDAWNQCWAILKFAHKQAQINAQYMSIVHNAQDIDEAIKNHRCAAILTVEGGSALGGKLETLDAMAQLGVKMITLTWNGSNELGHGCVSGCSDGLTTFGKLAVRSMEQHGILPDVSHLNEKGFWDVMECAQGAVVASHSVSSSVCEHARNLTDQQFCAIVNRGGLVGLNLCGVHLGEQTFDCLRRHLDHYLSLGGQNTVAFGCDLDGTDLPKEWGGIQVISRIYAYLQSKNYEESLLERVFFGNCYDFFHGTLTSGNSMG